MAKQPVTCKKYNIRVNPFFDKRLMPTNKDMKLYIPFGPVEKIRTFISETLQGTPRFVCLCGARGSGKSTLLNKLYYDYNFSRRRDKPVLVKIMLRKMSAPGDLLRYSLMQLNQVVSSRKLLSKKNRQRLISVGLTLVSELGKKQLGFDLKKIINNEFKSGKDSETELSEIYAEILAKAPGVFYIIDAYDPLDTQTLTNLLDEIQLLLVQTERNVGGAIVADKNTYKKARSQGRNTVFSAVLNEFVCMEDLRPKLHMDLVRNILIKRADEKRCHKGKISLPFADKTLGMIIKSMPTISEVLRQCSELWDYCMLDTVKKIDTKFFKAIIKAKKLSDIDQTVLEKISGKGKVYLSDDSIPDEMDVDGSTVRKAILRMHRNGLLDYETKGRRKYYFLTVIGQAKLKG